jgi:hypothetical protein
MGAPPDSWLDTMSIGRNSSYFSFNNPLASIIAASWECQLKTVCFTITIIVTRVAREKARHLWSY